MSERKEVREERRGMRKGCGERKARRKEREKEGEEGKKKKGREEKLFPHHLPFFTAKIQIYSQHPPNLRIPPFPFFQSSIPPQQPPIKQDSQNNGERGGGE